MVAGHLSNGRILLIEGEVVLGAVLVEVLRRSGYEVIFVRTLVNGGVERIDSVNVVILDIDTTYAAKELAWLDALHHDDELLPVVLLGLQTPQDLRHRLCIQLGYQERYELTSVQKPFRNEELVAVVREAYESSLPRQTNSI